ncbi:unnamed protein product [Rhizophagus irregularis]|nr:unnamed protein product [Rhizophagus irregularis]CAB5201678.1 unnamed protein product [Rhizophagus irregularis]
MVKLLDIYITVIYQLFTITFYGQLIFIGKYSTESHTGKFFASKISAIIEKIGVEKYSHIWDLRCIAHTINLMADDLVKLDNIKDLILDRGKITRFFNNSHQASAILFQGLKNMKIKIEGLQTWCKTR